MAYLWLVCNSKPEKGSRAFIWYVPGLYVCIAVIDLCVREGTRTKSKFSSLFSQVLFRLAKLLEHDLNPWNTLAKAFCL